MNLIRFIPLIFILFFRVPYVYPEKQKTPELDFSRRFTEQTGKKDKGKIIPSLKISDSKSEFEFFPKDKSKSFAVKTDTNSTKFKADNIEYAYEFMSPEKDKPRVCKETIVVSEPLKTNVIEFEIKSGNLDFYYQRPLSELEKSNGIVRAQNIEGSYAVYYKPAKEDGVAEKAFHIYRPDVTDKQKKHAWCDLIIDPSENIMKIIIPQSFLDTASYPIIIDPTIGYTTVGSTETNCAPDRIIACGKFTMIDGGIAQTARLFAGNTGCTVSMAIYNDNDGYPAELIDITSPHLIENDGWVSLPLNMNCHLSYGKSYWIAVNHCGSDLKLYFDDIGPQKVASVPFVFQSGNMPACFPANADIQTGMKFTAYIGYEQTDEDPLYFYRRNSSSAVTGLKFDSVTMKNESVIDRNLAAWFDFNGDSRDRTAQNDAVEHGISLLSYLPGRNDNYYVNLGGNINCDYIITELDSDSVGFSNTISLWIYPEDLNGDGGLPQILGTSDKELYPLYFDGISGEGFLKVNLDLNNIYRKNSMPAYSKTLNLTDIISNEQWFNFAQTYDIKTNLFKVYINGQKQFQLDCRPFEQINSFDTDDLEGINGVACDNSYIYTTGSDYIAKYSMDGSRIKLISNPEGLVGDICVVGNYLYISWMNAYLYPSQCGIYRLNKDTMTLDTTFATGGFLDLSSVITNCCATSICYDGTYFYITSLLRRIYKFSSDFEDLAGTYALNNEVVSKTGCYEDNDGQSFEFFGKGISFDPVNNRFHISFHGNLVLTIDSDFDNDSIQYYMPRDENTFSVFCQGLECLSADSDGLETIIFADRLSGFGNKVRIMKRKPVSYRYSPVSWHNLVFGNNLKREQEFFKGGIQDARIFKRCLDEKEIKKVYESRY